MTTSRELLATIPSVSFTTSYPEIYHADRIPAEVARVLDPIWNKRHYTDETIRVFRFSNVYAVSQGLVLGLDLKPVPESVSQHTQEDFNQAAEQVSAWVERGIETVENEAMVLVKPGWLNYGHWLIEILPQVHIVEKLEFRPTLFVPKTESASYAAVHSGSLNMLGVDSARFVDYDFIPRLYKSLLLVTGLTRHGPYMSREVFNALEACKAHVLGRRRPGAPTRRIYVKRTGNTRVIGNEAEVEAALVRHGFETVCPETLTLAQQIELFDAAEISVGAAGAGLTNMCWQRSGTASVALYPAGMQDTFFWWISQHQGIRFVDIRCAEHSSGNSEVSPLDIDAVIENFERGSI